MRGAEDRGRSPWKGECPCPQLWDRGPWTEQERGDTIPLSGALGTGSRGRQAHGWTPRPVSFLGLLFFAQLPSVYLSEQRGSHKEILDHIWVQQSHLEGFSSIPLLLASRGIFPLRCFASRIGNNQWMIPILIWIFREAEELLHSFSHLTTVMEQPLCRQL